MDKGCAAFQRVAHADTRVTHCLRAQRLLACFVPPSPNFAASRLDAYPAALCSHAPPACWILVKIQEFGTSKVPLRCLRTSEFSREFRTFIRGKGCVLCDGLRVWTHLNHEDTVPTPSPSPTKEGSGVGSVLVLCAQDVTPMCQRVSPFKTLHALYLSGLCQRVSLFFKKL